MVPYLTGPLIAERPHRWSAPSSAMAAMPAACERDKTRFHVITNESEPGNAPWRHLQLCFLAAQEETCECGCGMSSATGMRRGRAEEGGARREYLGAAAKQSAASGRLPLLPAMVTACGTRRRSSTAAALRFVLPLLHG